MDIRLYACSIGHPIHLYIYGSDLWAMLNSNQRDGNDKGGDSPPRVERKDNSIKPVKPFVPLSEDEISRGSKKAPSDLRPAGHVAPVRSGAFCGSGGNGLISYVSRLGPAYGKTFFLQAKGRLENLNTVNLSLQQSHSNLYCKIIF